MLSLPKTGRIKVIYDPPKCKENEIYLTELNQSEAEKPCGIITPDGVKLGIFRQNNSLLIMKMDSLEIIQQSSTDTLQGLIETVRHKYGLKDVLLFKDSKELKKWSN